MRITPFNLHQNIAFDNAISSIQYLHQLGSKIQDIISVLNNLETDYENYTDEKVEELKAFLLEKDEQLKDLVKEWIANLNSSLTDSIDEGVAHSKSYTDSKTNDLKEDLTALNKSMLDITTKLDLKVDARFNECNKLITDFRLEIYDLLNNFDNFKCYSPVTGEFEKLGNILTQVHQDFLKTCSLNVKTLNYLFDRGKTQHEGLTLIYNDCYVKNDVDHFTIVETSERGLKIRLKSGSFNRIYEIRENEPNNDLTSRVTLVDSNTFLIPLECLKPKGWSLIDSTRNNINKFYIMYTLSNNNSSSFFMYTYEYVNSYHATYQRLFDKIKELKLTYGQLTRFGTEYFPEILFAPANVHLFDPSILAPKKQVITN